MEIEDQETVVEEICFISLREREQTGEEILKGNGSRVRSETESKQRRDLERSGCFLKVEKLKIY